MDIQRYMIASKVRIFFYNDKKIDISSYSTRINCINTDENG